MAANTSEARQVLNYQLNYICAIEVRRLFRQAVLTGHADKGGSRDIAQLLAARDHLLLHTQIARNSSKCKVSSCGEESIMDNFCRYHHLTLR
jgi:hypothetical protein